MRSTKRSWPWAALLILTILSGCGGSDAGPGPAPAPTVSPATSTVAVNKSEALTASVAGFPNATFTWSVQGGNSNGTLSATTGNTVTYTAPAQPGNAVVTVTSGGLSTQAAITVQMAVGNIAFAFAGVPAATNSIRVDLKDAQNNPAGSVLVPKANAAFAPASFPSLSPGTYNATATAYATANGSGVAQAGVTLAQVAVAQGNNTAQTLTFQTTIDHLEITPSTNALLVGGTITATARAVDGGGNTVPVNNAFLTWTVTPTPAGAATVAPTPPVGQTITLTGVAPGSVSLAVGYTENGVTKQQNAILTVPVTRGTGSVTVPIN